jgi:hypothetical protein
MNMREKFIYTYGALAIAGGIYYTILFVLQYSEIHESWSAWSAPEQEGVWDTLIFLVYFMAIATPIVLLASGIAILKLGRLPLYLVVPFVLLMVLSSVVGKLILITGAALYIFNRWYCASRT